MRFKGCGLLRKFAPGVLHDEVSQSVSETGSRNGQSSDCRHRQTSFAQSGLESDLPESVQELHGEIEGAEAILLATPEYNRSHSPVLKNALDWGSRPEGTNKWKGKPVAVTGCTPYNLGALGAQHHLRQVLVYLDMPTLQQPEFYLEKVADRFNAQGKLTDDQTRQKIGELWTAFVPWIQKLRQT